MNNNENNTGNELLCIFRACIIIFLAILFIKLMIDLFSVVGGFLSILFIVFVIMII